MGNKNLNWDNVTNRYVSEKKSNEDFPIVTGEKLPDCHYFDEERKKAAVLCFVVIIIVATIIYFSIKMFYILYFQNPQK